MLIIGEEFVLNFKENGNACNIDNYIGASNYEFIWLNSKRLIEQNKKENIYLKAKEWLKFI